VRRRRLLARLRPDRGAGTVTVVGIVAAITIAALVVIGAGAALVARQRIVGAADAAALAAADVASGRLPGAPCSVAGEVAAANGAALDGCIVDGLVVTVGVTGSLGAILIAASATAGPSHLRPG
jgi:secretion/DNA translocation related TadE-like protein